MSPLSVTASSTSTECSSVLYQNTLTLLNSMLLLTSGVVSVAAVHTHTMKLLVASTVYLSIIVALATVFLGVQCCEYVHLY